MDQLEDVLNVDPMNDPDLNFDDSDDEDEDDYEPEYSVSDAPSARRRGRGQTIDTTISEPAPYGPAVRYSPCSLDLTTCLYLCQSILLPL